MGMYTATSLAAALKEYYADGTMVENVVYDKTHRPFLTMLKRDPSFEGSVMPVPVIYEDGGGVGKDFATAQGNVVSSQIASFDINVTEQHGVSRITSEAILRSRSKKGAFLRGAIHQVDSLLNRMANRLEANLFRSSTGKIGVIDSSGVTSHVWTLDDVEDVVNFFVGQNLVFAASVTSALRDSGTSAEVTAVNRRTGTITMDSTPTGTAAADCVFTESDYAIAGSSKYKLSGLDDWVPSSDPGATAFFGVDRSADPTRLGGLRRAGSLSDVEGSIIDLAADMGRETKCIPDVALGPFNVWRRCVKQMGAQVQRDPGGTGKGGYRFIEIDGPKGTMVFRPAAFAPANTVWVLTSDTWKLVSMGEAIAIDDLDGQKATRVGNASALEVRAFSWPQLACNKPGGNGRTDLT